MRTVEQLVELRAVTTVVRRVVMWAVMTAVMTAVETVAKKVQLSVALKVVMTDEKMVALLVAAKGEKTAGTLAERTVDVTAEK